MKKSGFISFGVALVISLILLTKLNADQDTRNQKALESAIQHALTLCYAQEGFFPASLSYLEDHYGIVVDSQFFITYEAFASNVRPVVRIYRWKGSS